MENQSINPQYLDSSWIIAVKKTALVISCMIISLFIAIPSTLFYYFLFGILTDSPQSYPGMESWQPFWTLCIMIGFLLGMFKSIIDIIDNRLEYFIQLQEDKS